MAGFSFAVSKAGLEVPVLVGLDGQTTTTLHAAGQPIPPPVYSPWMAQGENSPWSFERKQNNRAEVMAEMHDAAERAAKAIRDPERMRRARQSMDQIREEIREEHGALDIGVPAICELRDE